jgi:predicted transcriptional regulator
MRPIAIRLDSRTRAGLELLARVTGQSCAEHAAQALRAYVDSRLEALAAQGILKTGDDAGDSAAPPGRWDLLV